MKGVSAEQKTTAVPICIPTVVERDRFEEIYRQDALGLVKLAFLMVGSHAQAEEIVQDAFAQLLHRWTGIRQPEAYLRSCVVNGCRSLYRRRALEERAARRERGDSFVTPAGDHMADALARLPRKRRAAIVLRYYADLSEAEIAETLGVRPGTVKPCFTGAWPSFER